jgi:hypothetical protein
MAEKKYPTVEELKIKLSLLKREQLHLFEKIKSVCNKGCMSLEEYQKWIDAYDGETIVKDGIKRPIYNIRIAGGGERLYDSLPYFYPSVQTIEQAEEINYWTVTLVKSFENRWREKNRDQSELEGEKRDDAYEVQNMIAEYRQNEVEIQDIEGTLGEHTTSPQRQGGAGETTKADNTPMDWRTYGINVAKVLKADGKTISDSSNLKDAFLTLFAEYPVELPTVPETLSNNFLNRKTGKPYGKIYCQRAMTEINVELRKQRISERKPLLNKK